ncbi:hypothetical protein [Arthrobacter agilis]|uniref:hypothetical protein n=1 Tax=Arthrobacter agilis TaxID=37921 RepID=UPI00278869F8|nr:hypothetical protein [Arthrobacter agilis]MDQ0735981.1 hypothetical protein [Arthrobacter agilis]
MLDELPAEGISFLSNANGCDMTLEQAFMESLEGDEDLTSDATATLSYMTVLLDYFAELEGVGTDGIAGTVPLGIDVPGAPTLELATTTLPGLTLDGQEGVRFVATRAMPASGGVVSTIITCPSAVAADPAYFEQVVEGLFILPTP